MKAGPYLTSVRCALPEAARCKLDQALAGDALAARSLMIMAPRRLRGHIACLAYQLKTGNPAYREIVRAVWLPATRHLLIAFWPPQMVRRMLGRADFAIPDFRHPLTIFRPVGGDPIRKAAAGLCWSLSREAAVAAALAQAAAPIRILRATVKPTDIIYWGHSHGEQEIVCRRPVHAVLDEPVRLRRAARP